MNRTRPYFRWLLAIVLLANAFATFPTLASGHHQQHNDVQMMHDGVTDHSHCDGMQSKHIGSDLNFNHGNQSHDCCSPTSCHCACPAIAPIATSPAASFSIALAELIVINPPLFLAPPALKGELRPPIR